MAKYGHKSFCRQTLIGGNYGLLQNENGTIVPNPDFWAADLFNRLMTGNVINGNSDLKDFSKTQSCFKATTNDVNVHVYIHWEDGVSDSEDQLVVLVLNYGTEPVVIEPKSFHQSHPGLKTDTPSDTVSKRVDYVVTSDDLQSKNVWINGKKAGFPETGIPSGLSYGLEAASPNATMSLPGHSYAFYQFLYFVNGTAH